MADYSYQRYPPNQGENSYQPTYPPPPPQGAPAPMERGGDAPPYSFGSGYESSRGGGIMRGPMRGRGDFVGRGQFSRGGFGGGRGFPPSGPVGYNRGYPEVPKNQYNEREEWGPGREGPAIPPQALPQRPPQPQIRGSTILIHNLPSHVTEQDLMNHFGSAGMIKMNPRTRMPDIWLGPQVGEARITFQDPQVAVNAVQWYNNGDFQGNVIHVEMDRDNEPAPMPPPIPRMSDRGERGGPPQPRSERFPPQRGGYSGMRGARSDFGRSFEKRDGDWTCANPDCQNTNFKWRMECNRCRAPRPDSNGDFPLDMSRHEESNRFESRHHGFPPGRRGGPRGISGRGFPPRGMSGPPGPMGRGGYVGRGGGPMREMRGGRGGYPARGAPNGSWRSRPY